MNQGIDRGCPSTSARKPLRAVPPCRRGIGGQRAGDHLGCQVRPVALETLEGSLMPVIFRTLLAAHLRESRAYKREFLRSRFERAV